MARRGNGGLGAFATGLLTGYTTATKNKRDQEEHDLRMAKAKDERAMNDEFKGLDAEAKPAEGYVLVTPDGSKTVFADKKMAEEAQAAFGGDAKLEPKFLVGGQQYDSKDAADQAADQANAPAAKLRKRADIALKYNRPDIADAYTKNYNSMLEANRRDMQETFLQAQQTGDYQSVIDAYNKRLPNGATAEMVPSENGTMTLQITKGGQVVTQKPFASPDEFWNTMGQQVAQTPDNMLETWKTREGLKLQTRQVVAAENTSAAGIRKTDAEVAQMPAELALKSRQVGAAETGAGATAMNAQTARMGLLRPDVISGTDAAGNVMIGGTQRTQDAQGNWGLNVLPPQTVPGMKPTKTAAPSALDALLLNNGGAQKPLTIDWSKVPPRNTGGAAPQQPTVLPPGGMRPAGAAPALTADEIRRQQLINQIPR